jgi:hypothetical protein
MHLRQLLVLLAVVALIVLAVTVGEGPIGPH